MPAQSKCFSSLMIHYPCVGPCMSSGMVILSHWLVKPSHENLLGDDRPLVTKVGFKGPDLGTVACIELLCRWEVAQ